MYYFSRSVVTEIYTVKIHILLSVHSYIKVISRKNVV